MCTVESLPETNSIDRDSIDPADINIVLDEIKPVTLYRYVGPQGQLSQQGQKVLAT